MKYNINYICIKKIRVTMTNCELYFVLLFALIFAILP